jgi:hypothetical protein
MERRIQNCIYGHAALRAFVGGGDLLMCKTCIEEHILDGSGFPEDYTPPVIPQVNVFESDYPVLETLCRIAVLIDYNRDILMFLSYSRSRASGGSVRHEVNVDRLEAAESLAASSYAAIGSELHSKYHWITYTTRKWAGAGY